ncbi:Detected protein of unknown function [Hibiscus syriacus]|uniref:Uncharacterized protein n=1 Tax=Hibiscus syriacus TaxID=106335 RepID=A0A6A3CGG5_HIBSY|nr:Detected protein of unknown function [Hibiscus syriacus]
MVYSVQRFLMFLIISGLLAVEPDGVDGLTCIDLAFRHGRGDDEMAIGRNQRVLQDAGMKAMRPEAVNNSFDLNWSSKRRVPRGSDPIHNRS